MTVLLFYTKFLFVPLAYIIYSIALVHTLGILTIN